MRYYRADERREEKTNKLKTQTRDPPPTPPTPQPSIHREIYSYILLDTECECLHAWWVSFCLARLVSTYMEWLLSRGLPQRPSLQNMTDGQRPCFEVFAGEEKKRKEKKRKIQLVPASPHCQLLYIVCNGCSFFSFFNSWPAVYVRRWCCCCCPLTSRMDGAGQRITR